jgi:hypothetical protein
VTVDEARYVWQHRHEYTEETVRYAVEILERAGEL